MAKVQSKKTAKTATQREISESINNSLTLARRPARVGEIPEERLRKLRTYIQAAVLPMMEHVEEGYLTGEELVFALLCGAQFAQVVSVMHSDTPPKTETSQVIWGKK